MSRLQSVCPRFKTNVRNSYGTLAHKLIFLSDNLPISTLSCTFCTRLRYLWDLCLNSYYVSEFILVPAWVGSVAYGLSMTCGPITSFLISRFGNRVVMMTGSVICSVAVLSTSFVTDLNVMFGSFSVLYGLGKMIEYYHIRIRLWAYVNVVKLALFSI